MDDEQRTSEERAVEWTWSQWHADPKKTVLLLAACAMIDFFVHMAFRSMLFDVLALVALFYGTRFYWLPTRYRLEYEGVRIGEVGRRLLFRWERFEGFERRDGRIVLHCPAGSGSDGRNKKERLVLPVPVERESEAIEYLREQTGLVESPAA